MVEVFGDEKVVLARIKGKKSRLPDTIQHAQVKVRYSEGKAKKASIGFLGDGRVRSPRGKLVRDAHTENSKSYNGSAHDNRRVEATKPGATEVLSWMSG